MNQKLNILFLCGWYPSRVLPNNGDFIRRHAKAVSLQHNVEVLHIISDPNCTKDIELVSEEVEGIKTHIGYIKKTTNPILKLIRFWKTYVRLLKIIEPFDMVHLNEVFPFGIFALHLKLFQKKPFIISEHWTDYEYPLSKKISFLQKEISKIICKKASFICPVSNLLATAMKDFSLNGNYFTVENVVNTELFVPLKKEKTTFTIIHISNLIDSHKNISGMLRVAKQLEKTGLFFNWQFIGGDEKEYSNTITNLSFKKANIEFINHITQKELVAYLQKANLYISFSNYETFGIAMIESLACGTPVISTKTGILTELEENDYYEIIPINDEGALLNTILEHTQKTYSVEAAQEIQLFIYQEYSENAISQKFSNLYQKSLSI